MYLFYRLLHLHFDLFMYASRWAQPQNRGHAGVGGFRHVGPPRNSCGRCRVGQAGPSPTMYLHTFSYPCIHRSIYLCLYMHVYIYIYIYMAHVCFMYMLSTGLPAVLKAPFLMPIRGYFLQEEDPVGVEIRPEDWDSLACGLRNSHKATTMQIPWYGMCIL